MKRLTFQKKSVRTITLLTFAACFSFLSSLFAAPQSPYSSQASFKNPSGKSSPDHTISILRHEISNHEAELRTFEEKLKNQDLIIEALRQQLDDSHRLQKERVKGQDNTLEARILQIETTTKALVTDIKKIRDHMNTSSQMLSQQDKRVAQMEKLLKAQSQNLSHLETATRSLLDFLQLKDPKTSSPTASLDIADANTKTYLVQPGDSLDKIARHHHTSIQAIKDFNHLTNDRIITGQVLQIP